MLSAIGRNSTDENNLLKKGFVAASREEELDGKGLKVYVFKKKTDVTRVIEEKVSQLENPTDPDVMNAIESEEKRLVKECEEKLGTSETCRLSGFTARQIKKAWSFA